MFFRAMRTLFASLLAAACCASPASAAVLLFADNFNAPDIGNLDLSSQAGRRSGLNPLIQVRSSRIQHGIVGGQLNFLNTNTGRVRFHDDADNSTATAGAWYDWAAGAVGSQILADGGLRVEFDWFPDNATSNNWVAVNIGHSGESAGEPAFRVNSASNDSGILFRFNGATEIFDNGANLGAGGSSPAIVGPRRIAIEYGFGSFTDGTPVSVRASVNGQNVYNGAFAWSGNAGSLYMELETLQNTRIDNLSISTVPEPTTTLIQGLIGAAGLAMTTRRRRRA